jgi:hypothetical protein
MGRVYGEPIEVRTADDGRPTGFTWRKRRYAVSAVQEYWMINRDWWREAAPVPARPELEFWRVEASVSRSNLAQAGSYELRRDVAAGAWTLRRVAD